MENFDEKKILVIQDSVEVVRQPHADLRNFIFSSLDSVFPSSDEYGVNFASGARAARAVSSLADAEFDLVIFASNAIIRRETPIYEALSRNQREIQRFIRRGGSVIFLHQGFAGTESKIDFLDFCGAGTWRNRHNYDNLELKASHQLLRYPNEISRDAFLEHFSKANFPVTYTEITHITDPVDGYIPIATLNDNGGYSGDILACFEMNGRLVFSPSPLDWASYTDLFANILTYALFLEPDIVLLQSNTELRDEMRESRISVDYSGMVTTYLQDKHTLALFNLDAPVHTARAQYLIHAANIYLCCSPYTYERALDNDDIRRALNRGAALFLLRPSEMTNAQRTEKLELTVGPQISPRFLSSVQNCLIELLNDNWPSHALIHDVRDVEIALGTTNSAEDMPPIIKQWHHDVSSRVKAWFSSSEVADDPCTGVVALWLAYRSGGPSFARPFLSAFKHIREDSRLEANRLVLDAIFEICENRHQCRTEESETRLRAPEASTTLGQAIRHFEALEMLNLIQCPHNPTTCIPSVPLKPELIQYTLQRLHEWDGFLDKSGANIAGAASIARMLLYPAVSASNCEAVAVAPPKAALDLPDSNLETRRHKTLTTLMQFFFNVIRERGTQEFSGSASDQNDSHLLLEKEESRQFYFTQGQILVQRLIASSALITMDSIYPFGGANYIDIQASTSEMSEAIERLREQNISLRREIYRQKSAVADLNESLENLASRYYHQSKPQILLGVSVVWIAIATLCLIGLYLGVRILLAVHNGDAFISELVSAGSVIPVGVGAIVWALRKRLHDPKRWSMSFDDYSS